MDTPCELEVFGAWSLASTVHLNSPSVTLGGLDQLGIVAIADTVLIYLGFNC